jgi:hypothetical protein
MNNFDEGASAADFADRAALLAEVERLRWYAQQWAANVNGPPGPCPRCGYVLGLMFEQPGGPDVRCAVCDAKYTELLGGTIRMQEVSRDGE